jgi:SAM-dependent methyltransferase
MTSGPDFYDENDVFNRYMQRRQLPDNPNDTIEGPIFMEVLGDFKDTDVLDLGCGDGRFGIELLSGGCKSYIGIEASRRMVALAQEQLAPLGGVVEQCFIQDWNYPDRTFDLVLSRLSLHYVGDITSLFEHVYATLKPKGRFIFSVEHPVITSHNGSAMQSAVRSNWIVDDYFSTGERDVKWMGSSVVKFHRTIEDYFTALQKAQFSVETLREPGPQRDNISDDALYTRRKRIPLFLLFSAQRDN